MIIKGPGVTPGYVDERFNSGLFSPDGWFVSGDLGRFDKDGYLWLTGRVKDVIIRGGHNIDAGLIEDVLRRHPAVLLCAAVAKPDAYAGELPVAYVQLVKGKTRDAGRAQGFRPRRDHRARRDARRNLHRRSAAADRYRQAEQGGAAP